MSNRVMAQLNLKGKGGKQGILNTEIYSVIVGKLDWIYLI